MSESRRFCENCGAGVGETTNFCPSCGAAQRPDPDVPTGPPPPTPEPGRISTDSVSGVPPPPAQQEQPQRSCLRTVGIVVAVLVVLVVLGRACGGGGDGEKAAGGGGSTTDASRATTEDKTPEKKTAPAQKQEEDPNPHFGDGTQRVGSDIQAGTYRTREGSSGCYYARLGGFGGELGNILANDNTSGPAVVTVLPTDAGFESRRCGTWTQDLSQITDSTTIFGEGTFIVGTDIEPGTYRNSGSSGCYYERMSGFSGELGDIISNGNTDAPAVVQVGPTDAGFESKRCGTWEKID